MSNEHRRADRRCAFRRLGACLALVLAVSAPPAEARGGKSLFGLDSASVTYGPYVRLEAGSALTSFNDSTWIGPGPSDPRVFFSLGNDSTGLAGAAVGYDWMNGFRGDVGLLVTGSAVGSGPWTSTTPPVPGPHSDITSAPVRTTALMATVFWSPLEEKGVNSRVQPFLSAGLGLASNSMGDWTRTNPISAQPVRTFDGNTDLSLAFSIGAGVSWQITRPGTQPMIVEFAARYYDFGNASGSSVPLPGNGSSQPREPLNMGISDTVVSVSVRIPLRRW